MPVLPSDLDAALSANDNLILGIRAQVDLTAQYLVTLADNIAAFQQSVAGLVLPEDLSGQLSHIQAQSSSLQNLSDAATAVANTAASMAGQVL